ncbi:cupin domain-containing protein [Luteibacter flocculans]|uniref:Cupin domain-containing protein n=2 Tax=Luteibacter flocculans TaxID=2780091 RepID=A0ABY4SXN7_9GAMM|nr:cupin domain-containing protein [Luteibacter flocculans]
MSDLSPPTSPVAVFAPEAPPRLTPSNYPEPYASMMAGRIKRPLGDLFGLQGFGVNHVTLPPGAISALHHRHSVQDEFVFVLTGELTLVHDAGETTLHAGSCSGFPSNGTAHHLVNRSDTEAIYLEVGDRRPGDSVSYPNDDIKAVRTASGWQFEHKDGRPYG